jgi:hypothetical protein
MHTYMGKMHACMHAYIPYSTKTSMIDAYIHAYDAIKGMIDAYIRAY